MADGLTPKETCEIPSGIKAYQSISLEDFRKKFSSQTTPPKHFADIIGHFTTNEYDYPLALSDIRVREGLHIAVMGGLDPVFGQVAIAHPDLTIVMDINDGAITTAIEGRVSPLENSESGEEYWNKIGDYFRKVIRKKDPKRWDFPNDQDVSLGGWSNGEHFIKVKEILRGGKIKFVFGDITKDGLNLARKIAKETSLPLRLIYVSNIFSYLANDQKEFRQKLKQGIEEGWIDKEAQVIDTGTSEKGLETKVFNIEDYITKSI